jgi:enoyl-CoA hydratase/carnithine racemase
MSTPVHVEQHDRVRELRVDRTPGCAWDLTTVAALTAALVDADSDPECRVIVISAAGDSFCSGGEIGGPQPGTSVQVHRQNYAQAFIQFDRVMRHLGKPVIARVHGPAKAGGLAVVAACDVAVASTTVKLGTPEVTGGLFPLLAMGLLFEHLTPKRALAMFYSGLLLSAEEGVACGLLTESVPPAELDGRIAWWTTRLTAANPRALAIGRQAYWRMASAAPGARVELGGHALLELLGTDLATPDQSYMHAPAASGGSGEAAPTASPCQE